MPAKPDVVEVAQWASWPPRQSCLVNGGLVLSSEGGGSSLQQPAIPLTTDLQPQPLKKLKCSSTHFYKVAVEGAPVLTLKYPSP